MRFSVLGSGSKGNSVYIESGPFGILIDAGFSGKESERRLSLIGRELAKVHGICLTHEHNDHIRGAGVISRRHKIPIFANEETFRAGETKIGKVIHRHYFETGQSFEVGGLEVRSFQLSHDCADPVGFVISDGDRSLGYCTDTGKVSHLMARRLGECDALVLEFNHDLQMLKNGPYPLPLQQRVRSSSGHLCNEDAADFLAELTQKDKLSVVVQAHLSEQNNTPLLARKAIESRLDPDGENKKQSIKIVLASQHQPTDLLTI